MLSTTDKIVQTIADDIMDFDPLNMWSIFLNAIFCQSLSDSFLEINMTF